MMQSPSNDTSESISHYYHRKICLLISTREIR